MLPSPMFVRLTVAWYKLLLLLGSSVNVCCAALNSTYLVVLATLQATAEIDVGWHELAESRSWLAWSLFLSWIEK